MAKFNIGDKVRIVDADSIYGGSKRWNNGDITEVVGFYGGDTERPQMRITRGVYKGKSFTILSEEFHAIEKVEAEIFKAVVIRISTAMEGFSIGDIVTAKGKNVGKYKYRITSTDKSYESIGFADDEHLEVIREDSESLTEEVRELKRRVSDLEARLDEVLAEKGTPKSIDALDALQYALRFDLPPNELRKQAIEKAKKFVEDTVETVGKAHPANIGNMAYRAYKSRVEFVVNEDKSTVVAIVRIRYGTEVISKGIAKCAPDDVFNADIGKAIALGRAFGLTTSEFEQAPQPSEVVAGMVTKGKDSGNIYTVDKLIENPYPENLPGQAFKTKGRLFGWVAESQVDIISDTEAEYEKGND